MNLCEACWLRGIIPEPWTRVPPPVSRGQWNVSGINGMTNGCMGHGTATQPILIAGDASGGPDSNNSKFRKVGFAIAKFEALEPDVQVCSTIAGPLPGPRQVVARGEIQ
eukprot:1886995-Pyramimonas_sp.AAC.1